MLSDARREVAIEIPPGPHTSGNVSGSGYEAPRFSLDQFARKLNFRFSGRVRNEARTAGIICIAIGLAVLMLALTIPATSDFERVSNVVMAMAAVWIVIKGLVFLRKSSRTPKTPFE